MKSFDADNLFETILADIKNGDIKTTYNLRVVLEKLSEEFDIKALLILEMFKEWLGKRGLVLLTEHGVVALKNCI